MAAYSGEMRQRGLTIGFVPTMGALHAGHASLVSRALQECGAVVASVFVNPTQFNDPKDLERYPRTFDADSALLSSLGCHALFFPSEQEVYPDGTGHAPAIDLNGLDRVMEGEHRPGHFDGVVQVVGRLFDLVSPHRAYFGEKDFQQLSIIRHMAQVSGRGVQIVGCPTVREPDGLAMSSRNTLLSSEARTQALALSRCLHHALRKSSTAQWATAAQAAFDMLAASEGVRPEYLSIVDGSTLRALKDGEPCTDPVACVAAKVGGIRLIDNLRLRVA
jgi:pantoate--beta-alanine ligase